MTISTKPSIGLTQFIDFTVKQTMISKMNKVTEIKHQGDYHPARDHWKQLRERIKLCYEQNKSLETLDSLLDEIHERKINSYKDTIKAFKKFVRNKDIEWFDPPKAFWTSDNGLVVRGTPELGLVINGTPHLIKLFFKGDTVKLNARNIKPILNLMLAATYKSPYPPNTVFGVLNIKSGKLHADQETDDKVLKALNLEAQTFLNIWET